MENNPDEFIKLLQQVKNKTPLPKMDPRIIQQCVGKIGYDDHYKPISIDLPNALVLWGLH